MMYIAKQVFVTYAHKSVFYYFTYEQVREVCKVDTE